MKHPMEIAQELQALQILEDGKSASGLHVNAIRRSLLNQLTDSIIRNLPSGDERHSGVFVVSLGEEPEVPSPTFSERARINNRRDGHFSFLRDILHKRPEEPYQTIRPTPQAEPKAGSVEVMAHYCPQHGHERCRIVVDDKHFHDYTRSLLENEGEDEFEKRIVDDMRRLYSGRPRVVDVVLSQLAETRQSWEEHVSSSGFAAAAGGSNTRH